MFDESGIFDFLPLAQTPDRSGQPGTVHVTCPSALGHGVHRDTIPPGPCPLIRLQSRIPKAWKWTSECALEAF